jgi:hypothetical protein
MDLIALRQRIKARLDQLVEEALASANPPRTIEQVEALALKLGRQAQEQIAQELATAATQEAQAEAAVKSEIAVAPVAKLACTCHRMARYKGERRHSLVTLAGTLRVSRSYYYCRRCDQGFCPADRVLGLDGSAFTRRVQQEVARLCGLLAFAPAMQLLWELTGISVSAKHSQRLVAEAALPLEAFLVAREQAAFADRLRAPLAPEVVYVEADGVQTPMLGGAWRETKVGLVRPVQANGEPLGPTGYISHLGTAEEFGPAWYALCAQAGSEQARLTVAIGDGAAWIWNLVATHFPGAVQILDCWHALERLWEVGRAAYESDALAVGSFVHAQQAHLLAANWEALVSGLEAIARAYPSCAEKVRETLGYYTNHRARMDYPRYRAMGLRIGSGAAESGCKQVVTQRLKGAGMHWKEAGAQVVARLRCLLLSRQWSEFCAFWNQSTRTAALSPLS